MRKKEEERERCILLRKAGKSLKEIATEVGVSKGSVSTWVREIPFTLKQKKELHKKNSGPRKASVSRIQKGFDQRLEYQNHGRMMARERDPDYIAGCMLYWAEGAKSKNACKLSNTDSALVKYFVDFIKKYYSEEFFKITISISGYTNIHSYEEMEKFWLDLLGLDKSSIRKGAIDPEPRSSSSFRKKIHEWGICQIGINSTFVVQSIFGAIQEISGVDNSGWIWGGNGIPEKYIDELKIGCD